MNSLEFAFELIRSKISKIKAEIEDDEEQLAQGPEAWLFRFLEPSVHQQLLIP